MRRRQWSRGGRYVDIWVGDGRRTAENARTLVPVVYTRVWRLGPVVVAFVRSPGDLRTMLERERDE